MIGTCLSASLPCVTQPFIIPAGEKQGHSLLARDTPSLWHEAAAALSPLPAAAGASAAVTEAEFEAKKQAAIAALQNEETVFERDLGQSLIKCKHSLVSCIVVHLAASRQMQHVITVAPHHSMHCVSVSCSFSHYTAACKQAAILHLLPFIVLPNFCKDNITLQLVLGFPSSVPSR